VECQGEYWHNRPNAIRNDKSKSSYIVNNFSHKYEVKYIWEHEFACQDKVIETIKYWLGAQQTQLTKFATADITIKPSPADDYRLLLSKYHYLPNAGRGGLAYGAYLGDVLMAACVFSPLVRQNIHQTLRCKPNEVRELSRLCIHPQYQKKNFASWFVSRCLKLLPAQFSTIISYCDTTFNHDGAIYKACNFTQDATVKPDYWYVDKSGWVMHKQTLYRHATRIQMTEREYAELNGYSKVYGFEKLRFVYRR
jgi:GNAT superfamily N-acetyltransferase